MHIFTHMEGMIRRRLASRLLCLCACAILLGIAQGALLPLSRWFHKNHTLRVQESAISAHVGDELKSDRASTQRLASNLTHSLNIADLFAVGSWQVVRAFARNFINNSKSPQNYSNDTNTPDSSASPSQDPVLSSTKTSPDSLPSDETNVEQISENIQSVTLQTVQREQYPAANVAPNSPSHSRSNFRDIFVGQIRRNLDGRVSGGSATSGVDDTARNRVQHATNWLPPGELSAAIPLAQNEQDVELQNSASAASPQFRPSVKSHGAQPETVTKNEDFYRLTTDDSSQQENVARGQTISTESGSPSNPVSDIRRIQLYKPFAAATVSGQAQSQEDVSSSRDESEPSLISGTFRPEQLQQQQRQNSLRMKDEAPEQGLPNSVQQGELEESQKTADLSPTETRDSLQSKGQYEPEETRIRSGRDEYGNDATMQRTGIEVDESSSQDIRDLRSLENSADLDIEQSASSSVVHKEKAVSVASDEVAAVETRADALGTSSNTENNANIIDSNAADSRGGNMTQLTNMVYKIAKQEAIAKLAAAPCHTTMAWMPSVVARLESEVPDFSFHCVDTRDGQGVSEELVSAFGALRSVRIQRSTPTETEAQFPENMDLVVSWLGTQDWEAGQSWAFVKGLRRRAARLILFGDAMPCATADTDMPILQKTQSPLLFKNAVRVICEVGSEANSPKQLLLYRADDISDTL